MERFWGKVQKAGQGDCWQWTASKDRRGYGRFRLPTCHIGAHRIAYELTFGPIPEGLEVCHTCDNPGCVNPSHLVLGTHADNMRDSRDKGRATAPPVTAGDSHWTRTHPERLRYGESHPRSKLTNAEVRRLLDLRAAGASYGQLMAQFSLGKSQIARICCGQSRGGGNYRRQAK